MCVDIVQCNPVPWLKLLGIWKYEHQKTLIGMITVLKISLISVEIALESAFQPSSTFVVLFLSAYDESGHGTAFNIIFMSQLGISILSL